MTLTYDAFGNRKRTTIEADDVADPRITEAYWDGDGVFPTGSFDPVGTERTIIVHPALGVPLLVADANANVATYKYDGFGRLLTTNIPETPNLTRAYGIWASGNRRGFEIQDTQADGRRAYTRTDEAGHIIEAGVNGFGSTSNDPKWIKMSSSYDTFGNAVATTTPNQPGNIGGITHSTYDRIGQLLQRTVPGVGGAQTTVYEPSLEWTSSVDPAGHEAYVHRDSVGRIVDTGHRVAGSEYGEVAFTYGPFGHIQRIEDARGNRTTYTFDELGRKTVEDHPDSGSVLFERNGFGEITNRTTATGNSTDYTYDELGRVLTSNGPDGLVTRTYDQGLGANGQVTRIVAPDATTDYAYDKLGRLASIVQAADGQIDSVFHRYDGFGRLAYMLYPLNPTGRFKVQYNYNAGDGMLRNIRDVSACNVSTDPSVPVPPCVPNELWRVTDRTPRLQVKTAAFGNNSVETREYHGPTGMMTRLEAPGVNTTYEYDDEGMISAAEESSGRREEFTYDDVHRLRTWSLWKSGRLVTPVTHTYSYDEIGNITSIAGPSPFTASYSAGSPHHLKSSTLDGVTTTYSYDKSGRQLRAGTRTVSYNDFDLPKSVMTTAVSGQYFKYDGNGDRVKKIDDLNQTTTRYMGKLFESRAGLLGRTNIYYVHAETGVVAQIDYSPSGTKKVRYITNDRLGNPRAIQTPADGVEETAFFDPFGARVDHAGVRINDPNRATTFGFTGHEDDGGGLVNMRGRIYDRNQFRFLTPDPYIQNPLFGQSYNPYSYVFNNPTSYRDPSGFQATDDGTGGAPPDSEGGGGTEGASAESETEGSDDEEDVSSIEGDPADTEYSDDGEMVMPDTYIQSRPIPTDDVGPPPVRAQPESQFRPLQPLTSTTETAVDVMFDPNMPTAAKIAAGYVYVLLKPMAVGEKSLEEISSSVHSAVEGWNEADALSDEAYDDAAAGRGEAGLDKYLHSMQVRMVVMSQIALMIAMAGRNRSGIGPPLRGALGEAMVEEYLRSLGIPVVGRQIPIQVMGPAGHMVTTRIDIAISINNQLGFIEVKTGGSVLNARQAFAYPIIMQSGGVLGNSQSVLDMQQQMPGLAPGMTIGATDILEFRIPTEDVLNFFHADF
jgi:RHS repeat-associated protein